MYMTFTHIKSHWGPKQNILWTFCIQNIETDT